MGKTGKWFKHFLSGKKDKTEKDRIIGNPTFETISPSTPKEKRRWSFRRSSASSPGSKQVLESETDEKKHALAVATATAAAANAAVAAAKAAAAVIQLTAAASGRNVAAFEDAAATKIQANFRGYLARKALNALKGLVKLQALVRGHLVRKQAAATLKCMQALIAVQTRTRAQRLQMVEESKSYNQKQFNPRRSSHEFRRNLYQEFDRGEENIKIVEMDDGDLKINTRSRNSYSNYPGQLERLEHRISTHRASLKQDRHHQQQQISPSPSALTDQSPRAYSNHFDEYSFGTVQSSPQYSAISRPDTARIPVGYARSEYYAEPINGEYPFYPSYMANTKSSRAKVRSHSAPKQRPESYERPQSAQKQRPESVETQPNRRRPSLDGRNVPRGVRMQRSSSHVGPAGQNYHYPWSVKLDKSSVSLKDSECGSTSTALTNNNYCRSLFGYEVSNNLNH